MIRCRAGVGLGEAAAGLTVLTGAWHLREAALARTTESKGRIAVATPPPPAQELVLGDCRGEDPG
jgi:hypothetical protein